MAVVITNNDEGRFGGGDGVTALDVYVGTQTYIYIGWLYGHADLPTDWAQAEGVGVSLFPQAPANPITWTFEDNATYPDNTLFEIDAMTLYCPDSSLLRNNDVHTIQLRASSMGEPDSIGTLTLTTIDAIKPWGSRTRHPSQFPRKLLVQHAATEEYNGFSDTAEGAGVLPIAGDYNPTTRWPLSGGAIEWIPDSPESEFGHFKKLHMAARGSRPFGGNLYEEAEVQASSNETDLLLAWSGQDLLSDMSLSNFSLKIHSPKEIQGWSGIGIKTIQDGVDTSQLFFNMTNITPGSPPVTDNMMYLVIQDRIFGNQQPAAVPDYGYGDSLLATNAYLNSNVIYPVTITEGGFYLELGAVTPAQQAEKFWGAIRVYKERGTGGALKLGVTTSINETEQIFEIPTRNATTPLHTISATCSQFNYRAYAMWEYDEFPTDLDAIVKEQGELWAVNNTALVPQLRGKQEMETISMTTVGVYVGTQYGYNDPLSGLGAPHGVISPPDFNGVVIENIVETGNVTAGFQVALYAEVAADYIGDVSVDGAIYYEADAVHSVGSGRTTWSWPEAIADANGRPLEAAFNGSGTAEVILDYVDPLPEGTPYSYMTRKRH